MEKIKVLVRDRNTLVLDQDGKKGDIISLNELTEIDYSSIDEAIEKGKDLAYQKRFDEYKKLLDAQKNTEIKNNSDELNAKIKELNHQIELMQKENTSNLKQKENEVERKYLDKINDLEKQLETNKIESKNQLEKSISDLNNKNNLKVQELINNYKQQLDKQKFDYDSLKNSMNSEIDRNKLLIEKDFLNKLSDKDQEINKIKDQNEINKAKQDADKEKALRELENKYKEELTAKDTRIFELERSKASLNVKQTGEDLEAWCDEEVRSYMQNGLFNCSWDKDNDVIKADGETKGSKADFIFKVFASEKKEANEEIASICLDMKDENPDSVNKKTNADYYKQLDKNRIKKNCKYAVLVSNLELDKPNQIPMFRVREYEDMYVVRPAYLMTFLNMITSLSTKFVDLVLTDKKERLEYQNITDLMEQFDKLKKTYLDDPLATLEKNVDDIVKQNETISKASRKIDENCTKIINSYISNITKKLDNFDIKINKEYRKAE